MLPRNRTLLEREKKTCRKTWTLNDQPAKRRVDRAFEDHHERRKIPHIHRSCFVLRASFDIRALCLFAPSPSPLPRGERVNQDGGPPRLGTHTHQVKRYTLAVLGLREVGGCWGGFFVGRRGPGPAVCGSSGGGFRWGARDPRG